MNSIRFLETPIHHASDFIHWFDASGYSAPDYRPTIKTKLDITFTDTPIDLQTIHTAGRTALWRKNSNGAHTVVAGRASESDFNPPLETPYNVSGEVHDPLRAFNPREFTLSASNAAGHDVAIYRSPLGTQLQQAGGLRFNIAYDDTTPASWALARVTVSPSLGPAINFEAQADIHGDVVLPFNRLPALNLNAPSPTYDAILSVSADGNSGSSISNPDSFSAFLVGDINTAASFNATTSFSVSPGTTQTINTMDATRIIIQST